MPFAAVLGVLTRRLENGAAFGAHCLDMLLNTGFRFGIDNWPDIGGQTAWVAHPALRHRAAQHGQRVVGDIVLQAEYTQRRAALACAIEGRGHHVNHHLLGERGGVDNHRVHAAGFRDQRRWASLSVEAGSNIALQQGSDIGRTGKHHAAHAGIAGQLCADGFTTSWQQLHHACRYARFQQQGDTLCGNQRGLLGRFGQHAVTGGQGGGNLAHKDSQREVPRADTDHRAQRAVGFIIKVVTNLTGVVVQEVNCFTHFGNGVAEGFPGFAHQNTHQRLHLIFHQHRGAFQDCGTFLRRGGEPDWRVVHRAFQRLFDFVAGRFADIAHHIFRFSRVNHRHHIAVSNRMLQHWLRRPLVQRAVEQRRGEGGQTMFVSDIVEVTRQRDFRMRQTGCAFLQRHFLNRQHRVGNQLVQRQAAVGDTVNERGVSAVFQQTTHQIGQQGFVGAHRRINTAWTVQLAFRHFTDNLLVQRFAHAVQALELVLARIVVLPGQLVNRRQGMGVVGGKLRIN